VSEFLPSFTFSINTDYQIYSRRTRIPLIYLCIIRKDIPSAFRILLTYLLTYILTYLLTPRSGFLFKKPAGFQVVQKFTSFYGTRTFTTACTSARHFSFPETARTSHTHTTHFLKAILILSSFILLGLPSFLGPFPSSFSIKNLYTPLYIPIRAT